MVPLLRALKWLNTYIHNFGWSIIALTVLINIAIFPLRHRSMVSMRKMQTLQPQVKAIQERYKKYKFTDPERQKMNTETMALRVPTMALNCITGSPVTLASVVMGMPIDPNATGAVLASKQMPAA